MAKKKKIVLKKKPSRASGKGASSRVRGPVSASRASAPRGSRADTQPGAAEPGVPAPKQSRLKAVGRSAPLPAAPSGGGAKVEGEGVPQRVNTAWVDSSDHPAAVVLRLRGASSKGGAITPRQALFLINYLTIAGGNASMAYRLAGFTSKGANASASRLLANDSIEDAIRELAPLLAGGEGLLDNILLEAALKAVKKDEVRVMEKGKGKDKEKLTVTTTGGPDYKARISAAEKLKALRERGSSEGVGEDSKEVVFKFQNLETFDMTAKEKAYPGSFPPKD